MGWLSMQRGHMGGHATPKAYLDAQFTYDRKYDDGSTGHCAPSWSPVSAYPHHPLLGFSASEPPDTTTTMLAIVPRCVLALFTPLSPSSRLLRSQKCHTHLSR